MKKQRKTTIIVTLVCLLFLLSACSSPDSKYKPGHFEFLTTTGGRIDVYKPADPEEGEDFDVYLFSGSGRFRKKKFKIRVFDDFFGDGTETLTFRLLENDDERAKEYLETYNSWFE